MYKLNALFDGANGKLTDTQGEEIKCFLHSADASEDKSTEATGPAIKRSKRIRKK